MAVAIPIIAVALTAASTAYSVYSNVQAGHEARSQAHEAERSAAMKAANAAQDERDRRQRLTAIQRASYGALGFEMEGSPLLVQAETIRQSEENEKRILMGGSIEMETARTFGETQLEKGYYQAAQSATQGVSSAYNIGKTYNWWK